MSSTYINRSDPTAHDSILGIRINKRGSQIVSFGVKKVFLFFTSLSPLVITYQARSLRHGILIYIYMYYSLIGSMHFVRGMT